MGSIRLVIDAEEGTLQQRLDYDAFGNVMLDSRPEFQPFGFAAGIYLQGPNLVRFGARDYDPLTGRWTAKDPILFAGGQDNLYAYCGSDPVNCVDPSGTIEEPGFGESFIPIWGPGRQALHDIEHGNAWSAGWNAALSVSDAFLVTSIIRGIVKGGIKWSGSHTWNATRKYYTRNGYREFKGEVFHHWLIPQRAWGRKVPGFIKNQGWNLMRMPKGRAGRIFHDALHAKGRLKLLLHQRLWYGSPTWAKTALYSAFGRAWMDGSENGY